MGQRKEPSDHSYNVQTETLSGLNFFSVDLNSKICKTHLYFPFALPLAKGHLQFIFEVACTAQIGQELLSLGNQQHLKLWETFK